MKTEYSLNIEEAKHRNKQIQEFKKKTWLNSPGLSQLDFQKNK